MGRVGLDQATRRPPGRLGRGLSGELLLSDPLPLRVGRGELAAGLGEAGKAARPGGQTDRQFVTPAVGPELVVLGRIGGGRLGQDGGDLGVKRCGGPAGRVGGVGGEFRAVDRDEADLGQTGRRTQPQDFSGAPPRAFQATRAIVAWSGAWLAVMTR